ncbi:unnamed protein product [Medioppia subpectinata]|uniref:Mediator of RNA polymerase II transcription subunit 15 n=1 Tax=Medioppia subpectinata TaxID=1979941 RepID=A0A7R9KK84_9ACAR|nr:unnamed protein product [Medioppia subpectinata]CAG2104855.1 unnamed protein product [Medioppia subpectinata]
MCITERLSRWITKDCHRGCACKEGYVQVDENDRGKQCVLPKDCPSKIECIERCACNEGYVKVDVRGRGKQCVLPKDCPGFSLTTKKPEPECGPNGYYSPCGPPYPLTCTNYQKPPRWLTKDCHRGCTCKPGYVQVDENDRGYSLITKKPEPECGPNGYYSKCDTACPLTCNNYNNPPTSCVRMCYERCACNEGYVKVDESGRGKQCFSLTTKKPEPECGPNGHYTKCDTACPLTCNNYNNPPTSCTYQCVHRCACNKGYVKVDAGGRGKQCVLPKDCPGFSLTTKKPEPECGPNGYYSPCGPPYPLTCTNYQNPPRWLTKDCHRGCTCKPGYVQVDENDRGFSLTTKRPEPDCGQNKYYSPCGTPYPLTCTNYQNPPRWITKDCHRGCACKEGYVQVDENDRGKQCVLPKDCPGFSLTTKKPEPECGPNGHYTKCDTACPLTCNNYQNPPDMCTYQCVLRCACNEGYVKVDAGGWVITTYCIVAKMMAASDGPSGDQRWRTNLRRQHARNKIEDYIRVSGDPTDKTVAEMESHICATADTKEEYLSTIARLLLYIKSMSDMTQQMERKKTSLVTADDGNEDNTQQTQNYAKDSLDRFGDDMCGLILSYLSLEDMFCFECVSKQFRRTVFGSVVDITFSDRIMQSLLNDQRIDIQLLATIVTKCANIETIDCRRITSRYEEHIPEVLNIFRDNCRHLREIYCNVWPNSEQTMSSGQWSPLVTQIGAIYSLPDRQWLIPYHRLSHLRINSLEDIFDTTLQLFATNLRTFELKTHSSRDRHRLSAFVAQNECLKSLAVNCFRFDFLFPDYLPEICGHLSRLTQLRELSLGFDIRNLNDSLNNSLRTIGVNCKQLKRLSLQLSPIDPKSPLKISLDLLKVYHTLKRLRLEVYAAIDDQLLDPLRHCKRLTHLELYISEMTANVLKDLHQYCPRLQYLFIRDFNSIIDTECLSHISRLPALQTLVIYCNASTHHSDNDFSHLLTKSLQRTRSPLPECINGKHTRCETPHRNTNSVCGDGWDQFNDGYYHICYRYYPDVRGDYTDMVNFCHTQNESSLPTINTPQEQDFINKMIINYRMVDNIWLDARVQNGHIVWADSTGADYENWTPGHSINDNDYVEMSADVSTLDRYQAKIARLQSDLVPIGFTYVQLPGQAEPKTLWPDYTWLDVTTQYAGQFFRAEGAGSLGFGDGVQSENAPRLSSVKWEEAKQGCSPTNITPGEWSGLLFVGGCETPHRNTNSVCGDGWDQFNDGYYHICYRYYPDVKGDYTDMVNFCHTQNESSLPTINTPQEQDFLNKMIRNNRMVDNIWLDASVQNGHIVWADSTGADYENWTPGHSINDNDCVEMSADVSTLVPLSEQYRERLFRDNLRQLDRYQAKIARLQSDLIPIGFTYVQLPGQAEPKTLWPDYTWLDVTAQYAGSFFRAEGAGSLGFGDGVQPENSPRLSSVKWEEAKQGCSPTNITPGEWSGLLFAGGDQGTWYYHRYFVTGGEVRPTNQAVRIYKQTNAVRQLNCNNKCFGC